MWKILDVIEGRISAKHFKPEDIKKRMIDEGYLKEECAICGYHERRLSDYKMPLLIHFKDNRKNHYNLGNIRFLCYNCYFCNVSDVIKKGDKDMEELELHVPMTETIEVPKEFELDEYQLEQLEQLGVIETPISNPLPEDDGSELISRL